MKKIQIALLLLFFTTVTNACDICGCYMGILPNEQKDYLSLYYRYRSFAGPDVKKPSWFPDGNLKTLHGNHGSTVSDSASAKSYEIYRVTELRGRYYLHPRIDLTFIVPYLSNAAYDGSVKAVAKGIGDVSIISGYRLIENKSVDKFKHELIVGGGIKLPTGDYQQKSEGSRISLFSQTGTGSFDFFPYLNYIVGYKKIGISTTASYKLNGINSYHEKIGNSFTNYTSLFYKWNITDSLLLIPHVQIYYEFTKGLYVYDELQPGTRMNVLMVGPGFDVYYQQFGVTMGMQLPLAEQTVPEGEKSKVRIVLGITWNFKQNKFLIPKS